ncbi:MAG TPA: glycosyltransferase [Gemmatimonadales bacterium]|nr:glycosyltransferase [Gemmatimonadales bacterium]
MRVAFVTHNFPRHPGDLAGAFLVPLAAALRARGHDLLVVAPGDAGRGGEDEVDGVPVRRMRYASPARETLAYTGRMAEALSSPGAAWALAGMIGALRRGAREWLAGSRGVVHAHWWVPAGIAAPRRWPLVLTSHGTDARLLPGSVLARLVARPVYRRARIVTAVSSHLASLIEAATGRRVDAVQPMPLTARGGPARAPRGPAPGQLVLVARLTPQKRVDLAIEALALLAGQGVEARLRVVGDGPARRALERLAAARGLGAIVAFEGQVPTSRVAAFLAEAEVALFPAAGEGFGLAAVEALEQGTPVVACTDGGGVRDVLSEPGAGRLVAPTAEAIAGVVRGLLGDPAARAAARDAGRRWRDRLEPDVVAGEVERWYAEALGA